MSSIECSDILVEKQHTISFLEYFTQVSFKQVTIYICDPFLSIKYSLQGKYILRAAFPFASCSGLVHFFFFQKEYNQKIDRNGQISLHTLPLSVCPGGGGGPEPTTNFSS